MKKINSAKTSVPVNRAAVDCILQWVLIQGKESNWFSPFPKQHDIPLDKEYKDNTFHYIHEKEDIYIYKSIYI